MAETSRFNAKVAVGVLGVLALVAVGLFVWPGVGGDDNDTASGNDDGATFVVDTAERRDLVDEITVRGEIRRDELQRITSGIDGRVSSVLVDDGDTIETNDVIFALDGRAAVAVEGDFAFFRSLDVGSDGPDVLQLERILADDGYQVGIVDQLYTEETRRGLRQWQIDRGYGGATPEPDENIVVSLQNNPSGYSVGAKNTVSVRLGPTVPSARVAVETSGDDNDTAGGDATEDTPAGSVEGVDEESIGASGSSAEGPTFFQPPADVPAIEVTVSPATVTEGDQAIFTFTSDRAMPADTVIDYTVGGSATAGDDFMDTNLGGTFIFPTGQTSFDVVVPTLEDDAIEGDETLVITVGTGLINNPNENYTLGPLKEATLTIASSDDEEQAAISVRVDQPAVQEGGTITFTFEADRSRSEPTTIFFRLRGSARNGTDYIEIDPREVELPANATTVTLDVVTRNDTLVENDETVVVELNTTRRRADYTGTGPQRASATILADTADLPELTISGGGTIGEGESAAFTISADQAVAVDTSINYTVSGSATPGRDYQELSGTTVMRAGTSQVSVGIRSLDDDVLFQPGDMIVADWPARVGTVTVDEGEFILQGQEVLTLTEPNFTITMLLSPTDRGQLEVGLNATVELQASDQSAVPGIISELDDSATVDQAGNETYEGVVETTEDIQAVDGAGVNIDVTLEERLDVITVPVAAVLQDGSGQDVVRVVLTDRTTRQVEVEVGLSEGAFVEIVSGLSGDELVLIET